jgi:serine/threonine protein kinase
LKVLPEAFTLDRDRLALFIRNAQVLVALNAPGIAAIDGFEDSSTTHALVMELVEGPTLAEIVGSISEGLRLTSRPFPAPDTAKHPSLPPPTAAVC